MYLKFKKKGCCKVFNKKKLLSSVLACVISLSSVNAASFCAFADDEKTVMTFDGKYDMEDYVDFDYFSTDNDSEIEEKLIDIIERKAGVKDYSLMTYKDLAKITTLDLSGLKLVDVPSCINYMTNLTRLDLSSNYLQSDTLKKLSLLGCTKLSNIDLSDNYLTTMPSWFMSDRVKNGKITKNFVDSENPRYITATQDTYYLMNGEEVNEDDFKNQILKTIRLNDNKELPEIFFEYNGTPAYPKSDGVDYPYQLDIVSWKVPITDGKVKVSANSTVEVEVRLFNDADNANTVTTITVYLLNDKDLYSLKKRLESLVKECDSVDKDAYTETTYNNFSLAYDTAQAILKYGNADVQMLTNALESLTNAKQKLHLGTKDLQDMLKELVTVGGKYKESDYTPESWSVFSKAFEKIKAIASDKNATIESAQSAVKSFQNAQSGLKSSVVDVPDKILKAEFEKIYGENKNVTASGKTSQGTEYKWTFNGRDIAKPADFSPEVKDTDTAETEIMVEAGSVSNYRMFVTSGKDTLPGKAVLQLDVSDKFTNGKYYLYKWDSSAKRSVLSGTVQVKNGIAEITLEEGGVYYICPTIQNFPLVSSKFDIDDTKKSVMIYPKSVTYVSTLKNSLDYGTYTTVLDKDGKAVSSGSRLETGMTVNAPNMDKYRIVVMGDADNNGVFNIKDLESAIDMLLEDSYSEKTVEELDFDGNGKFSVIDIEYMLDKLLS